MTPNFLLTLPLQTAQSDVMEELTEITLTELCRACGTHADIIIELANEGVMQGMLRPPDQRPEDWRFTGNHLHQAKIVMRLQRDLGVNLAGAALALQLIEEIELLKQQLGDVWVSNRASL